MLKKSRYLCYFVISILIFSFCLNNADQDDKLVSFLQKEAPKAAGFVIQQEKYLKDGISASYPVIISGAPEENLKVLNQMIAKDFNKILQIYSFHPFPESTSAPVNPVVILTITDIIKLNNGKLLSILYKADFSSKYVAHPTNLVYTTNIDTAKEKRLKLSDIVKLSPEFVKYFKTWDFISNNKENKEVNDAIRDYINGLSEEDLLKAFQSADIIGSENLWGTYSYLTPDSLGISLSVPNFLGDHVEFEKKYSELKDYLIEPDNISFRVLYYL